MNNTLVNLIQQPLHITKSYSWHQRTQQPLQPKTITKFISPSSSSWKIHAQAKGFGDSTKNRKNAPKISTNGGGGDDDDDDDEIPQIVFDRMIRRIMGYVGVPLALGVVLLKLFDLLKEKHLLDVPLWVPFVTTFLTFGSSVLGVAYGSLSTSWDAEKKGSLLGLEEAKLNWDEMWKEENNS